MNEVSLLEKDIMEMPYYLKMYEINKEIESNFEFDYIDVELTDPKADKYDYLFAASSGLLTASLNILWSGKFNIIKSDKWGSKKRLDFFIKVSSLIGYDGNNLKEAIEFILKTCNIDSKTVENIIIDGINKEVINIKKIHGVIGLYFSILSQFTSEDYFIDGDQVISNKLTNDIVLGESVSEKIIFGIYFWATKLIVDAGQEEIEKLNLPKQVIENLSLLASLNVIKDIKDKFEGEGHLVTYNYIINQFKNAKVNIGGKLSKFDLDDEVGIISRMTKGAFPVIANDLIVRLFYFVRRLYKEIIDNNILTYKEMINIDSSKYIPKNSRSLTRMLTVSSGVFMAVTTGISFVKSKGDVGKFLLNINIVGIGYFSVALSADLKYIVEDISDLREAYMERHYGEYVILDYSVLNEFMFNEDQTRVMLSLQYSLIKTDINKTSKNNTRDLKEEWLEEWMVSLSKELSFDDKYIIKNNRDTYALLHDMVNKYNDPFWVNRMMLQLSSFVPYYVLDTNDIKKYSKLKYKESDVINIYEENYDFLDIQEYKNYIKLFKNNTSMIKNQKQKVMIGVGTGVVTTVAAGALALAFAPQIAILIAGASVKGLSGAALTNASLALVGGGSLAAGGLGMAGGTAIIAGGGALLGGVGTGTISTAIINNSDETMLDSSRILTISKDLIDNDPFGLSKVLAIRNILYKQIYDTKKLLSENLDIDDKVFNQKSVKVSIKYLERTINLLDEMINDAKLVKDIKYISQ